MQVLLLFLAEKIAARHELLLTVGDYLAAEPLNCVVYVLFSEYNAWTTCQSLHHGASVLKLCQKFLHEAKLFRHVKMLVWIDLVVQRGCELLERMDPHLDFWL